MAGRQYLSDDPENPSRWKLPDDRVINPGEFVLIWTNGSGDWIYFTSSTPGYSNSLTFDDRTIREAGNIQIYPNPVKACLSV